MGAESQEQDDHHQIPESLLGFELLRGEGDLL